MGPSQGLAQTPQMLALCFNLLVNIAILSKTYELSKMIILIHIGSSIHKLHVKEIGIPVMLMLNLLCDSVTIFNEKFSWGLQFLT